MENSVISKEEALELIKENKVRLVSKIDHEKDGQVDIKFRIYKPEKKEGKQ